MYPRERRAMWRHVARFAMCVFLPASLASCAVSCEDLQGRYGTFKGMMMQNIGSLIDKPMVLGSVIPEQLIASRRLPNGNIENEYRYFCSCRSIFEFDPKTRIIVNWKSEGRIEDCAMP